MVQHVKDDPVLQVSSQEPSASFKYDFEDGGPWGTSKHARELKFGTQVKNHISGRSMTSRMTPSSKSPVRNLQCPPSMTSRMGGSWHTTIHARELKFVKQIKNHISWWSMMSRRTPSSTYSVRNHQRPPSMDFEDGGFLTHLLESGNLSHKSRIMYHDDPLCQEWPHPPSIQSGPFNGNKRILGRVYRGIEGRLIYYKGIRKRDKGLLVWGINV